MTIHPAPLELLLGGDASELVDTDFSVLVLKKMKTTIQNRNEKKTKTNKGKQTNKKQRKRNVNQMKWKIIKTMIS